MNGDHAPGRATACGARRQPARPADIAKKALTEAIGAGQMDLALSLARTIPAAKLPTDARLLLVADEIRHRRAGARIAVARGRGDNGDLTFLAPLITAWDAADRGNADLALSTHRPVPVDSLLGAAPVRTTRRCILLKFRRTADAEPFARRAIGSAGAREDRLRLAFADGFLAAGDKARALMMLDGHGRGEVAAARQRIAGRQAERPGDRHLGQGA